ncbi:MAG: rhamnulokinase [Luteolibacter sp.]
MKTGSRTYLAVDLGASSGRVMAGVYDGTNLELNEIHRFPNSGMNRNDAWHWDMEAIMAEVLHGLSAAACLYGDSIVSIAVDTWGVDYQLLDAENRPLSPPRMYRDSRTNGVVEQLAERFGSDTLWRRTGLQPMYFNTIYQLVAELRDSDQLDHAKSLRFIPDWVSQCLCGVGAIERSIASTSGLLQVGGGEWDFELMDMLGIPRRIFMSLTEPCQVLGELLPGLLPETAMSRVKVCTCGSHDTASAVAAVPSFGSPLFISSGTWSLMGLELAQPILTDEARAAGFSNEQGLFGTTRFLSNISGLWLWEECRRVWFAEGRRMDHNSMVEMAATARAEAWIDPDAADFQQPCDMPSAIRSWIAKSGQAVPASDAALLRTILESLVLRYRAKYRDLRRLVSSLPETLHIVGGGSQNRLLNQMTADATGLRVVAGPVEATVCGNVLAQMIAMGEIRTLGEGRGLIRNTMRLEEYQAADTTNWEIKEESLAKALDKLHCN